MCTRKLMSRVVSGMIVFMIISSVAIQVKANNYTDSYDTAVLDDYNGVSTYYTTSRYKEDTSKGYVRNIASSYSGATAFTLVASTSDNSTDYRENFKLYRFNVTPGNSAYLTNLVKESGYNYAAVKVEPGSDFYMETRFAWSPDNVNGY